MGFTTTVVVIGAGQAGLSAGFHLQQRGFVDARSHPEAEKTFVIFDVNHQAGGAWNHRWESLTMETVNAIFDLPGFPVPPIDLHESSRIAVPRYFADYEGATGLPIIRPLNVYSVDNATADMTGELLVHTKQGDWRTQYIINATGTWNNPNWPSYPGKKIFTGKQLHTRDYVKAEDFVGQRVAVVGGGISALQQLEEISRFTDVLWYTRRPPVFREGGFRPEVEGRATIEKVTADAEAGKPTDSIVSYTGLTWSRYAVAARERGVLHRRPMFSALEPHGVREADGTFTSIDTILWATGFKADLAHLEPLKLRNDIGGIKVKGTRVVGDPRVHLIGFGPSQSTVGANRAGRAAVTEIAKAVEQRLPV